MTPWTVARQAPLSQNFPGKNTGAGCHFPLQGIFPHPGMELTSPACGFFIPELPGKPQQTCNLSRKNSELFRLLFREGAPARTDMASFAFHPKMHVGAFACLSITNAIWTFRGQNSNQLFSLLQKFIIYTDFTVEVTLT